MDNGSWDVPVTKVHTHQWSVRVMVYCTECGREQADMAKFCRYCGERMPGLDLTLELKREAAAIQQAKSGPNNIPQKLSNPQQDVNGTFRTGTRLGGA